MIQDAQPETFIGSDTWRTPQMARLIQLGLEHPI